MQVHPYLDGIVKSPPRRATHGQIKSKLKAPFKVHEPAKLGRSPARPYVKNNKSVTTKINEDGQKETIYEQS